MSIVPIRGLFEAHLTVGDLDRAVKFYRDVLGLPLAYRIPERGVAFFWVPAPERGMLGLWSTGTSPLRMHLHTAFSVDIEHVIASVGRLRDAGLTPLSPDAEPVDEPVVLAWMPAASVYFDDPDGNSLEYIALLPDPPLPELGRVTWSDWRRS